MLMKIRTILGNHPTQIQKMETEVMVEIHLMIQAMTNPTMTNPPNEGERFLQVMSDLAAGIRTMRQPQPAARPEKVKVHKPDTFDSADP